ncbi:MAG: hypothetical protein IKN12_07160, partial [Selenomonadaceae bacterium]|nr:hypothetical protein [Selenomonadaceae bacterium]
MEQAQSEIDAISKKIEAIKSHFQSTVGKLDWDVKSKEDINNAAKKLSQNLSAYTQAFKGYQNYIKDANGKYTKLDNEKFNANILDKFKNNLKEEYGIGDALAGAGYIGTIYGLLQDIKNIKSPTDALKVIRKGFKFGNDAKDIFLRYKKVGNMVGNQKAMTWWAKFATGLKPLGRYSTASKPIARFVNNLKNKTSPFNAQIKDAIGNFAGSNGIGAAVASWGTVLINGILNWQSNKEEQANSDGKMSDGRVVAETITETAIDTGLMIGATAVAGAAITAFFPAVSAGVAVVALSGLLVSGINAGIKAITDKSFTEWASDAILDGIESINSKVGGSA